MFPNQMKSPLFNNMAGGWKKPGQVVAPKVSDINPNMPHNLPGLPSMADGLPTPVQGPRPADEMPKNPAHEMSAPHPMHPMNMQGGMMPNNPLIKKSGWMGMK